jgi:methylaspartate ammonia-lyase
MTKITGVLTIPTLGGDFIEDLSALHSRPIPVSKRWQTKSSTPGYQFVRQPAATLSVGLELNTGQIIWGECVPPVFSTIAGRDPVFDPSAAENTIKAVIAPTLIGKELSQFKSICQDLDLLEVDDVIETELPDRQPGEKLSRRDLFKAAGQMISPTPNTEKVQVRRQLRSALLYGTSQAILVATALSKDLTLTEVICQEWDLPLPEQPVPIHGMCEANYYHGAEKLISCKAASLPHGRIDNIPEQVGKNAVQLIKYSRWLRKRIRGLGPREYHPRIHLDLQGSLGIIHDYNLGKILGTISSLESALKPYLLRLESPVIMPSLAEQIQVYQELRDFIRIRNMTAELVVSDWANSPDSVGNFLDAEAADMVHINLPVMGSISSSIESCLECKGRGVGVLLGGSSSETDLTARISAQIALALQPDLIAAKPGLGVLEGFSIVNNQMKRTLLEIQTKMRSENPTS